jgi:phosphatidylglycerol:prolipoprotein diacylglycerol transferase
VPAVLTFAFDPVLHVTDAVSIRFETALLAVVLFVGLLVAARIGHLTPTVGPYVPAPGLSAEDLPFIAVGAVPGAIVGGRLGYVLDHLDYYRARPDAIADLAQGGLSLTLAVPLGIFSAAVIARLIDAPVARWAHALAFPLLLVLAAGKLAGVLGATGQGVPSDLPWATAYLEPGPWGSLAADVPSHPSQVYEALLIVLAMVGLSAAQRIEVVARRDGAALFVALGLWAVARLLVAFTWRDAEVLGPLRIEQLLSVLLVVLAVAGLVERWRAPLQAVPRPDDSVREPQSAG